SADPSGSRARRRRGPGGVHPGMAKPARTARPGSFRRLAPSPSRSFLHRRPPPSAGSSCRGRALAAGRANGRRSRVGRHRSRAHRRRPPAARPDVACRRRPAFLPGDAAARGGERPGHSARHGEVAPPSIARPHAPRDHRRGRLAIARERNPGMTADRLERRLPDVLNELALPRVPDYVDTMLSRTERMPQRPGWSFPERWFPVSTIATALPTRRRPALRPLIVAAVVLALIAAALVAYVGSRPRPAPLLGLARNGPVLITDSGSIVEVDLTTGSKRTLASGTNLCCAHVSPDGLRFSYSHVPSPGADT